MKIISKAQQKRKYKITYECVDEFWMSAKRGTVETCATSEKEAIRNAMYRVNDQTMRVISVEVEK